MSTEIDEYLRKKEWIESAGSALLEHAFSPAEVNKRINKRLEKQAVIDKQLIKPITDVFGECIILDD